MVLVWHLPQTGNFNSFTTRWGVHKPIVTKINTHMRDTAIEIEKHQIADARPADVDMPTDLVLLA